MTKLFDDATISEVKRFFTSLLVLFSGLWLTLQTSLAQAGPLDTPIQPRQLQDGKGVSPDTQLATVLQNGFTILVIIATLTVIVFVVWGAFEYIASGGDADKTKKAREKIISALVGLAILAFAFFLVAVVGQLVGFNVLGGQLKIPTLSGNP